MQLSLVKTLHNLFDDQIFFLFLFKYSLTRTIFYAPKFILLFLFLFVVFVGLGAKGTLQKFSDSATFLGFLE